MNRKHDWNNQRLTVTNAKADDKGCKENAPG